MTDTPKDPLEELLSDRSGSEIDVLRDELESYRQRADLAEARLTEALEGYRQMRADVDILRERHAKKASRQFDAEREVLLLRFIEVLDNLDRALEAAQGTGVDERLAEGLILVRNQLLQILQSEGLERVPVLGQPFDPAAAEAVQMQRVDDPDRHHFVLREIVRGYKLDGRLVRPARVVVGEFPDANTN